MLYKLIPTTRRTLSSKSPHDRFSQLPDLSASLRPEFWSNVGEILAYIAEQERFIIKACGEFLERIRDKDAVT